MNTVNKAMFLSFLVLFLSTGCATMDKGATDNQWATSSGNAKNPRGPVAGYRSRY